MKHRFTIVKRAPASRSNVIANYFDLEHVAVHRRLHAVKVLSETERAACLQVTVRVAWLRFSHVQHVEYTPPGRVVQIVKTLFGPMRGVSTIEEVDGGTPEASSVITTDIDIDFPPVLYPLRHLVQWQFSRINNRIFDEDCTVLARRQKLFGEYIDDYLADGHYILFKAAIRDHFATRSEALHTQAAQHASSATALSGRMRTVTPVPAAAMGTARRSDVTRRWDGAPRGVVPAAAAGPSTARTADARRRALAALLGLVTAWGCGLWLAMATWAELYWHRSRLFGFLSAALIILPVIAYSRFAEPGRWRIVAAIRTSGMMLAFAAVILVFDHHYKDTTAWARWAPAMAVDFLPVFLTGTPWLAPAVIAGLAVCYYAFVYRLGRGAFFLAFAAPAAWLPLAILSLYNASFADLDVEGVRAQPGVRVLAPTHANPCSPLASRCSVRLFPRAIQVDERTDTAFVSFGSTASTLHFADPKVMAINLMTGDSSWLDSPGEGNQVRTLDLDRAARVLAFTHWSSRWLSIYDVDTRQRIAKLRFPFEEKEEAHAAGLILDGDGVITANVWYPHIVRQSRATGAVEHEIDLYDERYVEVGVQLSHLLGSSRRGRAWVMMAQPGTNVLEMDIKTLEPLRTLDIDTTFPATTSYDDTLGRLFVTAYGDSTVEIIDVDTMDRIDVLQVPGLYGSRGIVVDARREMLYLTDYRRGDMVFYSLRERRELRRLHIGPKPAEAALSGDALYVSTGVGLVAISLD